MTTTGSLEAWQLVRSMLDDMTSMVTEDAETDLELIEGLRAFLATHPGDGGAKRYTWADTELNEADLRPQVAAYQDRYAVPTETLR